MTFSATLDSRLVLPCLAEVGLGATDTAALRELLAGILSGSRPSPGTRQCQFVGAEGVVRAPVSLELLWDGIRVSIDADRDSGFAAALEKFGNVYEPAIQELLKKINADDLTALDTRIKKEGATINDLRGALAPISLGVAMALVDFHSASVNRVVHEEIVGFLTKTVRDKSARVLLGQFLLIQFPLPSKRTHRFVICQALENLAEPELGDGLAKLALNKQNASLRGWLCEALARSKHPDAAKTIATVLDDCDDETRLGAIESLGRLKAKEYAEKVRALTAYQSEDKEWTRAIKKAAEKALKALA